MGRLVVVLLIAVPALRAQETGPYHITHTFVLGGEGSWDYVIPDPPNHRLFIGRQNRVMVVDPTDGRLLGEVTGINGAHGVALAPGSRHGFATSGNDSSVVMFDPISLKVLGRIPAAEDADAIIYDPASDRVFTFNGDAHSSTVVDPKAGRLVTNLPLGGKPESGATAGNGKAYVNIVDNGEVVEIDTRTLTVTRRWSTAPCRQPVAMAIDTVHHRLFSGCRSGVLAVSDYQAGKVLATAPIGSGVDGTAYDPTSGDIFASNVDGTLTVIHEDDPDHYHVVQNLTTAPSGRNMGLDPITHRVYVVAAKFGPVPAESTAANPRRRAPVLPGSFMLMVIERSPAQAKPPEPTLPQAVANAFHTSYPTATILSFSRELNAGKVVWEVESRDGSTRRDLLYAPTGETLEIEETIPAASLPAPVRDALKANAPNAMVTRAERVTRRAVVTYELAIKVGGKSRSLAFDRNGKPVKP